MIKAAFFDIDGTLYSHTKQETCESTMKALHSLKEKGIKIFLATGRHFRKIEKFSISQIPFDGYVTLNGQICTDSNKNLLFGNPIKGPDAQYLVDVFEKKERPLMIIEQDRMYINFIDEAVKKAQEAISTGLPQIDEYHGAKIYQFIGYVTRAEEEELAKMIPNCKLTRWYEGGVDIISKFGGKVTGIRKMLEAYGLTREEIIAFGDGENDMEMLEFAGIGVAMGNAKDVVKEKADYVTAHIDEDGIAKALKHFGLIE